VSWEDSSQLVSYVSALARPRGATYKEPPCEQAWIGMESSTEALERMTVHHVAVVVPRIEDYLEKSMWREAGAIVHDPQQHARLCLVRLYPGMSPPIELVEPVDEESPTWSALQRGTTWHHICLRVTSQRHADELIRQHRFLAVTGWKPAVLFDGRPVRFAYTRNRELIEFLSEDRPGGQ
jgi:Glyoxalase/Bleomycin resistance protein/Dioxygenase superfamily